MSSILTNTGAMSALQNLAATQRNLAIVQSQVSTGLKIANASDNAASWTVATKMKSDVADLSSVTDALNLGFAGLNTANTALTAQIASLGLIQQNLVSAQKTGADRVSIQAGITALLSQMNNAATSSTLNGVNYLAANSGSGTYAATVNIVSSFARDTSGNVSTSFIGVDRTKTLLYNTGGQTAGVATVQPVGGTATSTNTAFKAGLFDAVDVTISATDVSNFALTGPANAGTDGTLAHALASATSIDTWNAAPPASGTAPSLTTNDAKMLKMYAASNAYDMTTVHTAASTTISGINISKLTDSSADQTTLANLVTQVNNTLTSLTNANTQIGAMQSRVQSQTTFVSSLSDSLNSSIGALVDADMNAASTRLQALQTQQELGIQALSIANQNSQIILKLFGG